MRFLFVIDPIKNINPLKDSSAALMQASSKKNIEIWSCTPQDLEARGDEVWASSVKVEVIPWISFKKNDCIPLAEFNCIWMRNCLLYTSPSPRDATLSRMPSSA